MCTTSSPAFIVCRLSGDGHSDWCEMMSHCSFDLHFSKDVSLGELRELVLDREAWHAVILGVAKSRTRLRD